MTVVFDDIKAFITTILNSIGITNFGLEPYGSSINGLALRKDESDLDLTLIITNQEGDFCPMEEFDEIFNVIIEELSKETYFNDFTKSEPSRYRVHTHSASFGKLLTITDVKNLNYKIDISVNKVLDLYNSQLLRVYALLDERFHMMALLIKSWNKKRFPSKIDRLNSYSIVLMIIAFLQFEEILPRLQLMSEESKVIRYVKYYKHKESS
jgi:DNA polymerase sigma